MNLSASQTLRQLTVHLRLQPSGARPLRWRLLALCIAGLLPLFLAATATLAYMLYDREQSMERSAMVLARSIGASLQAEVNTTVAALETLSGAESLAAGRLKTFEDRARSVARARQWRTVTLIDRAGRLLLSTDDPNAAGQQAWERASVDETFLRNAPTVGAVVQGQLSPSPAFPIRIPIVRDDQALYVLSAVVSADRIMDVVKRQQLSNDYVVAIFDAAGTRVARSADNATRQPSPSLQALIESAGSEAAGLTRTLEGQSVHTAFHRVVGSNWGVAVGIPVAEARTALLASLGTALAGLLASLTVSAWLAWFFARKVSQPISELTRAAGALGRGEPVHPVPIDIEELQQVGAALQQAAAERERASAEREDLLAKTAEALKTAEGASRAKDEFLAVLGHELRNPLAPISSALRLMDLKGDAATRSERRIVERQLGHMTRLVDDLLDVSRITGRQLVMHKKPMQVGPWIAQCLEAVSGSLAGRRLQLDLPQPVAQCWVMADAVRLAQVLANLLGNAVKFTGENGRIGVSARQADGQLVVEVADDGLGMTHDETRRVFEPFYQAPQALDRSLGGLGLGLSIVFNLMDMHGGSVDATSAGPGQGSRFTLRLDCVEPPADPIPSPSGATTVESPGTRVLVVDDNCDAADTAGALLETYGLRVSVVYTPEQALSALDTFDAQVAVLDIGLPGMDGYQLAAAIRRRPGGARIGLIALTGYGQDDDVRRARDAGFDAHLTKPVGPDELLAVIGRSAAR